MPFHRTRAVALVASLIVLLLALPASASAGWRLDRAKAVAAKAWGNPCAGRVEVRWAPIPNDVAAFAEQPKCRITFSSTSSTSWVEFCSTMIHEYGHLAGFHDPVGVERRDGTRDYEHSPDPRSVMYPEEGAVQAGLVHGVHVYEGADARCANRGRTYLGMRGGLRLRERFVAAS